METSSLAIPQPRSPQQADLGTIKARQRAAWSSGDYAVVGTTLQIVGEELCEALDLRSGQRVLDVAAGNGNASLAAARRWCDVTATVADDSFDAVMSTFGVMFTADHDRAARELVRVCRPGGKIGLANWTPEGFIGQLFKTIGRHVPPPPALQSPAAWGIRGRIGDLFESRASSIRMAQRNYTFRYRSPDHWLDVFRTYYGPVLKAFAALAPAAQPALERDLRSLIHSFNRSGDTTMVVPSEYLEIVITRR
jgi:hypothetical protein